MHRILLAFPFPPSVTVLGSAWSISVPGLSRLGLTFVIPAADPSKESARVGALPTRELALLPTRILGCLVYLVCKLDNKICSIFGFQGTRSNRYAITPVITL